MYLLDVQLSANGGRRRLPQGMVVLVPGGFFDTTGGEQAGFWFSFPWCPTGAVRSVLGGDFEERL